MSDEKWTRDQKLSAVSIAVGAVGTTANFIKPITDAIGPFYWIIQPFLFLGIGLFIGYAVTRMLYNQKIAKAVDAATKPLQEQVDSLMNREQFALMRLRGLSLKELGIVRKFMAQGGEVYLKADDASVRKLADSGMVRINTDTYCPPDLFPFTLDDSLRSLLVEFPDTLDRAMAEAESVKSRYSEG